MSDKITRYVERKTATFASDIQLHTRQRISETADGMDRRSLALESCEHINHVMHNLIDRCYARDKESKVLVNIDLITFQILIPVPWGRHYARWGLRFTESYLLRQYVWELHQGQPLFAYNHESMRWRINSFYQTHKMAREYWTKREMNTGRYLRAASKLRFQRKQSAKAALDNTISRPRAKNTE